MIAAAIALAGAAVSCTATDGDTLRCGRERVRLLGIDAPELPGHCRRGRRCVDGDPYASRAGLAAALTGPVILRRIGRDLYGRTLALATVRGRDLGCLQLASHRAIYQARYDEDGLVAAECGVRRRGRGVGDRGGD